MSRIEENKYKNIINLPHPNSKKHPRMSLHDRSAQFAPFAALTGYEEEIQETARVTFNKLQLDEEKKEELDEKLKMIKQNNIENSNITITYFVKDERKDGGEYVTERGNIKKIDEFKHIIVLENGTVIQMENIVEINMNI